MLLWLGFALAAMATAPVQAQTATETLLHHFARHQLDRHEDRDDVAAQEESGDAQGKQHRAKDQVPGERHAGHVTPSPFAPEPPRPEWRSGSAPKPLRRVVNTG